MKQIIQSDNAPKAIGCYSQAVKVGETVYLSGQIGLDPQTMRLLDSFEGQTHQVFKNLSSVMQASGGTLADICKLNVYVLDMANFAMLNQIMSEYFKEPYPARAAIAVRELPKGALVEMDAIALC